jgi:hypothetical protein
VHEEQQYKFEGKCPPCVRATMPWEPGTMGDLKGRMYLLLDNLVDFSKQLQAVSKFLSSRGSAFKALPFGKHAHWKAVHEAIVQRLDLVPSIKAQLDAEL